jgi:hypothetical protein
MSRGVRAAIAVAAGVLIVLGSVGCGGQPAAHPAVPWSDVKRVVERPKGSYTKTTVIEIDGDSRVMLTEWVSYDLSRKLIDRRIGIGDDPSTVAIESPPSRDAPSLRFIYYPRRAVMWNPGAETACGTPWVEMPHELIAATTGIDPADVFVIEPAELLLARRAKPRAIESDAEVTVYEITVDGTAGVPSSSAANERQSVIEKLRAESNTARVVVPRGGTGIEMSIDVTHAMEALAAGPVDGAGVTVTWTFGAPDPAIGTPRPAKVVNASCLG